MITTSIDPVIFDFSEYDEYQSVMVYEVNLQHSGVVIETRYQIVSVHVFGVNLTNRFDTKTVFNEEDGELSAHLTEVIEGLLK